MLVRSYFENGFDNVLIENDFILAVFVPALGSKMIRLINKETGTQFLLDPQVKEKEFSNPGYGEEFSDKYAYGLDDCFPTVSSTIKDINVRGGGFPDHGELWSRPWNYRITDKEILFKIFGAREKYSIDKVVSLAGNKLTVKYSLKNLSNRSLNYIWCAHPLLRVTPGDKVILPFEVKELFLNESTDAEIGSFGDLLAWPIIEKNKNGVDYSLVQDIDFGKAVKCFSDRLKFGYAGLHRVDCNETILFSFNPDEIKYLGVWLCYGGWPYDSFKKQLTIALEPSSGRPDSLIEAIKRNEATSIGISEERSWSLEISLWKGMPDVLTSGS